MVSQNMININEMISIIIPCRNEEHRISACLDSIVQFVIPEKVEVEILVVDGNSDDKTVEIVNGFSDKYPQIRLMSNPDQIQSCGLNIGIRSAKGEYILRLDAHSQYPQNYLNLCHHTMKNTGADIVGGIVITLPGNDSPQALLVQMITTHSFGVGNAYFRTKERNGPVDTVPFGFFHRAIFDQIGYFDERLVRNQDYEFNCRIRKTGGIVWSNPDIRIFYYNQTTLSQFLKKQFILEAPYNVFMWYLAPYTFKARHAITGIFTGFVICGLLLSIYYKLILNIYCSVMVLYFALSLRASFQQARRMQNWSQLFILPFAFFSFHFVHGLGVLKGLIRLILRKSPVQKVKEPWPGARIYRVKLSNLKKLNGGDHDSYKEDRS